MKKLPGFTLVEVLITASVIAILSGASLVGYARFQDNQRVVSVANQLAGDLRLAQEKALSGKKPTACTGDLAGWRVVVGAASYTTWAVCPAAVKDSSRSFSSGISATAATVNFAILTGAAGGDTAITVTGIFGGAAYTKTVTVTGAGGISVS